MELQHFSDALTVPLPFVSLAGFIITVGLVLRVLLVDAVVGQVHELVAQSLHGRRIPEEDRRKITSVHNKEVQFDCSLHKLKTFHI